jgi:hypothetical protein
MNDHVADRGCPTEEVWLEYLDARADSGLVADRGALAQHLDGCGACASGLDELRRFNTLLLRSRVPKLSDDQWSVLDERMEMMGSEYVPPPKVATKIYFGLAMAAAFGLFAVGVWHLVNEPSAAEMAVASADGVPINVAAARPATLVAGAVDGKLEATDLSGVWRPLNKDDALRPDMRLRSVGPMGTARLVVPGHFELRIGANSELQVLAANERSTWLRVRKGEVACQVEKRRPNQQFKVLAGRFRASVVGTEFVVRHGGDDAAVSVRVTEGAVRVDEAEDPQAAVSETTTLVRAGNRWKCVGGRMEFGPIQPATAAAAAPGAGGAAPTVQAKAADRARVAALPPAKQKAKRQKTAKPRVDAPVESASAAAVATGATGREPAAHESKVVEIKLPAQWHKKAHEVEVKRLENLGSHSKKARGDVTTTATPPTK